MPLNLPYYYGHSGEQYAFFRIPKLLLTDDRFAEISTDAKLLYGLLLDRMELSYALEIIRLQHPPDRRCAGWPLLPGTQFHRPTELPAAVQNVHHTG